MIGYLANQTGIKAAPLLFEACIFLYVWNTKPYNKHQLIQKERATSQTHALNALTFHIFELS